MGYAKPEANLRDTLRSATACAHNQLDAAMRAGAGWSDRGEYTRFLSLQYSARQPVEMWLLAHAPRELRPPPQAPLIAQDLHDLRAMLPGAKRPFALSRDAGGHAEGVRDQTLGQVLGEVLGVAWVLAGSSLGNKAIRADTRRNARREGEAPWPDRFLRDPAMLAYWKRLKARLEDTAELERVDLARRAASNVFAHFLNHTRSLPDPSRRVLAPAQAHEGSWT